MQESQRYGEKWSKKWAQEAAYIKIHGLIADVLHEHATPCNKSVYPTWEIYLQHYLGHGNYS
jgi:hypothetical protein